MTVFWMWYLSHNQKLNTGIVLKTRDNRYDTLKGFLILLVVFGHFFSHDSTHGIVSESCANFIYSFHMPLFVFISGLFTSNQTPLHRSVLLLETYVFFQLIKGLWRHYSFVQLIILPGPMLWYLFALFFWRLIYALMHRIGLKVTWFFVIILVLLSLAAGFFPWIGREFALSRFIVFAPFFFIGIMAKQVKVIDSIKMRVDRRLCIILLVLVFFISICFAYYSIKIRGYVFAGVSPYPIKHRGVYMVARLINYLTSSVISIAFIRLFSFDSNLFGIIGRDSLKYYMFHGILLMVIESFAGLPWSPFLALLYATIVTTLIYYFNKTDISDFALTPVSFVINHCKR